MYRLNGKDRKFDEKKISEGKGRSEKKKDNAMILFRKVMVCLSSEGIGDCKGIF